MDRFDMLFHHSRARKKYLAHNPNLTTEQIDLLYSTEGVRQGFLLRHSKLTDEQFNRFFNDPRVDKDYLARNPNLTPEQIDLLYSNEGVDIDLLAQYPKLTDEQFNRFFHESVSNKELSVNPSINPLPVNKWQSGLFNWSW